MQVTASTFINDQEGKKRKGKCGRKNAEGKCETIKKMHLPLSAQPRRTTVDDMIRWEMGVEQRSEEIKKSIICVTNA
jgi:hypothetical protein